MHDTSVDTLVAVDGPLSISLSSRSSSLESSDDALVSVLLLAVDPAVEVRFSGCLPVKGGLAMLGLGNAGLPTDMALRKSM